MRLRGALSLLPPLLLAAGNPGLAERDPDTLAGLDVIAGKALFEKLWVSAPSSTGASDGLGPYYQARSCAACHPRGGAGGLDAGSRGHPAALVIFLPDGDERYGRQLQDRAVPGLPAEASIRFQWEELELRAGGGRELVLRRPRPLIDFHQGRPPEQTRLSPRLAPPLFGLALLEQVPRQHIEAWADPLDRDGDGISGRAAYPSPGDGADPGAEAAAERGVEPALGRFGWRAGQTSLLAQGARALALDLGIGNPRHPSPHGDCTAMQAECLAAPGGNGPAQDGLEAAQVVLDLVRGYLAALPAPSSPASGSAGEQVFHDLGCAGCHRPAFTLEDGREIRPFTDLLLHDLGPGLADYSLTGEPLPSEWRTTPLWGLADRRHLLHDGRARNIEEAILWHDGEAAQARERFRELGEVKRRTLLEFLHSL